MRDDSFSLSLRNESLNVEKLAKIADFLDVHISELFVKSSITIEVSYEGETKKVTGKDLIDKFFRYDKNGITIHKDK